MGRALWEQFGRVQAASILGSLWVDGSQATVGGGSEAGELHSGPPNPHGPCLLQSDIVSLHCPLLPSTFHIINAER